METKLTFGFVVALISVSVFFDSSFVRAQSASGDPFNYIFDEHNAGSWKDEIMSSITQVPGRGADDTPKLVLAANRTERPDILSEFRKYRGGWDISDRHYWASVGFTGAPVFILAVLWFVVFGAALLVYYICGRKLNICGQSSSWSSKICIIFLAVFTSAAVTGCISLSVGQEKFHKETFDTVDYLVNQSEYTVHVLRNVTGYLSLAKNISVAKNFLPSDVMDDIDRVNLELENSADTLEVKTNENSAEIQKIFDAVESALIAVAVGTLLVSILGLVLSIFRHGHIIHIFIVSGWLLVTITLILCGASTIIDNSISDACMAMEEWVENPHSETALSDILPCVDESTTNQTLFKSKQVINDIVNIVNEFLGSVANSNPNPTPNPSSSYYNQSGPSIPPLCYPYDSELQDRNCSAQELSFDNATLAWRSYACVATEDGVCTTTGRLTPEMYAELVAAVNVGYALEHYAPPLLNLRNCNFVRDTFRNIARNYCPPLEYYIGVVDAGLALISAGVMISTALWIARADRNPMQVGSVCSESSAPTPPPEEEEKKKELE
ncbi:uncharacterized protein LOC127261920 [Andrographis paniculata]|uniref:uncharacterized protein LOC127261920 n=1 Tax=Andrographis paniculata TaxID=175694 RepID=UPI0021E77A7F|nr:uncharacterized protein LOC127261920 [Andrographis paniculata]